MCKSLHTKSHESINNFYDEKGLICLKGARRRGVTYSAGGTRPHEIAMPMWRNAEADVIGRRRLPGHHIGQSRLAGGHRQSVGVNAVSRTVKSAMISLHRRTPAGGDPNFNMNVNRIRSPSSFDSVPPTYSLVTSLYRRMAIHSGCGVISLAAC